MMENLKEEIKVCHVTSAHKRYDIRIFHKECKSLANNGFDVKLLVNDIFTDEARDGVEIISTQFEPKNRFERMVKSKKIIRKKMLEIDADIYHFHDPELLPEASRMKKRGKKVIFDSHEDVSQQILFKAWIPKYFRKAVSFLYASYEKQKVRKLDALISVTPKIVERLKEINSNTVMVTNYPIIRENNNDDNFIKKRAICFAGGISPQWNHENIIKAIENLEDIEYILAGSGSQKYIEKLQNLEGWKKVRYLGRIPHEEVKNVYKESMIGMTLLSNNTQVGDEGTLGNTKIFEFMEAGLPVVCSNNKIWNNIVTEDKCGKSIDVNNIEKIKETIRYILDNPEEANNMGENGKKAVKSKFNWTIEEKKLFGLYESI